MTRNHCWGEWLQHRAGDGLPYPDEHEPRAELPSFFSSNFSIDKAKRESVAWSRTEETCDECGGLLMLGTLNGEPVARACQDCPETYPPACPAGLLAKEWRDQS